MSNEINYSPGAVANHFLKMAWGGDKEITPRQLQKLAYFANGWYMALYNEGDDLMPLINEPFQAWEYGPVCSSVYHEFKGFGSNPVYKNYLMTEIVFSEDLDAGLTANDIRPDDQNVIGLLKEVWDKYSHLTALQMSEMTHIKDEDNPWRKAREEAVKEHILRGKEIRNIDIKKYFKKILEEKRAY